MHVPDTAALSIALIENIRREDLSAAGGDGVDATQTVHLWRSQSGAFPPGPQYHCGFQWANSIIIVGG